MRWTLHFALSIILIACGTLMFSTLSAQGIEPADEPGLASPFQTPSTTFDPESVAARFEALESELAASIARIEELEQATQEVGATPPAAPKLPSVIVTGVFQADGVAFNQTDASRLAYGRVEGGGDFRRARLGVKGAVTDRMDYFMQMDFGFFGRPTFTDLWVDFKDSGPLGTVRVGQWKQPFGLETVSSFRYTTFMERSSLFQPFTPFRHLGIGFYDHSEDLNRTWALSYLRTGQDQFGGSLSTDGGNGMAARLTQLLWYGGCDGNEYLHVGGGYFLNEPPGGRVRYRSIPEIYVGEFVVPTGEPIGTSGQPVPNVANGTPFFTDTGTITDTDWTQTFGTEALWVSGPFSLQSEMMGSFVESDSVGSGFLYGTYAQAGWFLTGEHRPYDRKAGAVDRVKPFASLTRSENGIGAWEIAARWSYLDLADQAIMGGEMQNATFGLNWYVNPNCKCVFNYIHSWADSRPIVNGAFTGPNSIESQTDAFAVRCQVDF